MGNNHRATLWRGNSATEKASYIEIKWAKGILPTVPWTCHAFSMCYLQLEFCILYFFFCKKSAERVEHFLGSGVKIRWAQKVGEL